MQKKKSNLSPDAAKILEQYRNAGKKTTVNEDGTPVADGDGSGSRQNSPPPPQPMRRSGTRGK
ncbi:MAG: hypothetical protein SFU56_05905 [Capsulimonadales bacterium]|nr:hypothetical protein [Capsulimonadales bacterium]